MKSSPAKRGVLAILFGGLVLAIVAFWQGPKEPEYQRKKLSEWLIDSGYGSERSEAVNAVREMGTNALPWLLKWRNYNVPAWQTSISVWLEVLPLDNRFKARIRRMGGVEDMSNRALWGFGMLGGGAKPAIPELKRLARSPPVEKWALFALVKIGKEALPALLELLSDPAVPDRGVAIEFFATQRVEADAGSLAGPTLVALLQDNDRSVSMAAAYAIGLLDVQTDRETVVSSLVVRLDDGDAEIRGLAARYLAGFGVSALSAVPKLTLALSDTDPEVRIAGTNALLRIAPEILKTNGMSGHHE